MVTFLLPIWSKYAQDLDDILIGGWIYIMDELIKALGWFIRKLSLLSGALYVFLSLPYPFLISPRKPKIWSKEKKRSTQLNVSADAVQKQKERRRLRGLRH